MLEREGDRRRETLHNISTFLCMEVDILGRQQQQQGEKKQYLVAFLLSVVLKREKIFLS